MRLYRVSLESELFVLAESDVQAERLASAEWHNETPDCYAREAKDAPGEWLDALPYGDNPGQRTVRQILAERAP